MGFCLIVSLFIVLCFEKTGNVIKKWELVMVTAYHLLHILPSDVGIIIFGHALCTVRPMMGVFRVQYGPQVKNLS